MATFAGEQYMAIQDKVRSPEHHENIVLLNKNVDELNMLQKLGARERDTSVRRRRRVCAGRGMVLILSTL